jgi:uncharacterized protein YndB with AHSA1/START domain
MRDGTVESRDGRVESRDGTVESRDGRVESRDGREVLLFERRLAFPVDRVWAALTRPEEIIGWLAEAEIQPVAGARVWLRWLNAGPDADPAMATGIITALDPPRLLEYVTSLHGALRWELEPDADGSRLRFTNLRPRPAEDPAELLAGWHVHLDFLERALAGHPVDWPNWPAGEFRSLHEHYLAGRADVPPTG